MVLKVIRIRFAVYLLIRPVRVRRIRPEVVGFREEVVRPSGAAWRSERGNRLGRFMQPFCRKPQNARGIDCSNHLERAALGSKRWYGALGGYGCGCGKSKKLSAVDCESRGLRHQQHDNEAGATPRGVCSRPSQKGRQPGCCTCFLSAFPQEICFCCFARSSLSRLGSRSHRGPTAAVTLQYVSDLLSLFLQPLRYACVYLEVRW